MSEITSYKKDRDVKLWDAAVEYCNENYKGDDNKYAACHKTFIDAVTSPAAKEYYQSHLDQPKDTELTISAFQFENGVKIKVCTGLFIAGHYIKSYKCDNNWRKNKYPFAECPLTWSGRTDTEFHNHLRNSVHGPESFVPDQSTKLL